MAIREVDSVDSTSMSGVSFSQGKVWKSTRKLFLSTLSNMGMGNKFVMDGIIQEEAADFCSALRDKIKASHSKEMAVRTLFPFSLTK